MSDRYQDIRTFVTVVQAQGFQAAALRLGLVKSAVSRRIADLEARLGTRLLNRTTQQISLTDPGEAFYWRGVKLLADLREAEEAASSAGIDATGTLRISTTVAFANHCLAPVVGEFLHRHPRIRLEVEATDHITDMVGRGHDLAIRTHQLADSSLITRCLTHVRYMLTASPDYLRAHGTPSRPSDLSGHRWVVHRVAPRPSDWLPELERVEIRALASLDNEESMLRTVIAGGGIALLPNYLVDPAAARRDVVTFLPELDRAIDMQIVFPSAANLPHKVRAMIEFLVERFAGERLIAQVLEAE